MFSTYIKHQKPQRFELLALLGVDELHFCEVGEGITPRRLDENWGVCFLMGRFALWVSWVSWLFFEDVFSTAKNEVGKTFEKVGRHWSMGEVSFVRECPSSVVDDEIRRD